MNNPFKGTTFADVLMSLTFAAVLFGCMIVWG